jgi:hypothetical protein
MSNLSFNVIQISPLALTGMLSQVSLTNYDTEASTGVGMYITPTAWIDPLDYPSDNAPDTDYNDLLAWGSDTFDGTSTDGGLYIIIDSVEYLFRYGYGDKLSSKIPIPDIEPGDSIDVYLRFDTPTGATSRRFLVDFNVE